MQNTQPTGHKDGSYLEWIRRVMAQDEGVDSRHATLGTSAALIDLELPFERGDDKGLASFLPSTALHKLTGVAPEKLRGWTILERHLLNHFLQCVARSLAVVEDRLNPLLRYVTPMALENTMLKHAIMALSASHLSNVYPILRDDALVYSNKTLQVLRKEMEISSTTPSICITILLLCLTEVSRHVLDIWQKSF